MQLYTIYRILALQPLLHLKIISFTLNEIFPCTLSPRGQNVKWKTCTSNLYLPNPFLSTKPPCLDYKCPHCCIKDPSHLHSQPRIFSSLAVFSYSYRFNHHLEQSPPYLQAFQHFIPVIITLRLFGHFFDNFSSHQPWEMSRSRNASMFKAPCFNVRIFNVIFALFFSFGNRYIRNLSIVKWTFFFTQVTRLELDLRDHDYSIIIIILSIIWIY